MLNWASESEWQRLVAPWSTKTTWRWWWKDILRGFYSETLPHGRLTCTWTSWPQSNTPALSRMVNLSYPWRVDRVIRGINNRVSHIRSFTPGPDAIFKKSCKFYTSAQDVNLKQDAVKAAFWNNVRFVDSLSLKALWKNCLWKVYTARSQRGFFFPSTECLGLIKISPQTLAGSWMRLIVQRKHRFINTVPHICRAECTQRHEGVRSKSAWGCGHH